MRIRDLFKTCLNNLFRHKSRTFLTILGVIVGCCSVVIMISFGTALKLSMESFLDEMGDLSVIEVSPEGGKSLEDSDVSQLSAVEGVAAVLPQYSVDDLQISLQTKDGRYVCSWAQVVGMDTKEMSKFDFQTDEGTLPSGSKKNSVVLGKYTPYDFADTMRPDGYNMIDYWSAYNEDGTMGELPEPYFDPMTTELQLVISSYEDENKKTAFDINVSGIFRENTGAGYVSSNGVVMDTKELTAMIRQFKQENGLPAAGKAKYSTIYVKAKDISSVSKVDTAIKALKYQTYSMESIRDSIEKEANQKQLMFGGLGVVSLFVAALGIMNTMITAISERTREIGVMKALGCFVGDIRRIFLLEAGCIGFIGGVIGSIFSVLLSFVINIVALQIDVRSMPWEELRTMLFESTERISVVPWQLAVGAVGFSVLVGVLSGFYPANRAATKISALEAIKTE